MHVQDDLRLQEFIKVDQRLVQPQDMDAVPEPGLDEPEEVLYGAGQVS